MICNGTIPTMNTTTPNTQAQALYVEAAEEILEIIDNFGFRTDTRFEPDDLKARIVNAIQKKVEGNR